MEKEVVRKESVSSLSSSSSSFLIPSLRWATLFLPNPLEKTDLMIHHNTILSPFLDAEKGKGRRAFFPPFKLGFSLPFVNRGEDSVILIYFVWSPRAVVEYVFRDAVLPQVSQHRLQKRFNQSTVTKKTKTNYIQIPHGSTCKDVKIFSRMLILIDLVDGPPVLVFRGGSRGLHPFSDKKLNHSLPDLIVIVPIVLTVDYCV